MTNGNACFAYFNKSWGIPRGSVKNEKAQLGTCNGVAEAGYRLDGVLTVAHAV